MIIEIAKLSGHDPEAYLKRPAKNLNRGDSHTHDFVIHMWTPPLARADFVEVRVIGCFHMSGLIMRLRKRRWP